MLLLTSCRLLTILLDDVLAWRYEFGEALELVASHRPVASPLQREVSLEVRVEVLLERDVAHEPHAAQRAVKLYARKNFHLSGLRGAIKMLVRGVVMVGV